MKNDHDQFNVLRKINSNPNISQRDLAKELNLSLGKINYCLKALKSKGLVKIQNFKKVKTKWVMHIYLHQEEFLQKQK